MNSTHSACGIGLTTRGCTTMGFHDLIISYKTTENHNFPLILVVGREPSNDEPFSKNSGPHDFDNSKRCAFWNTSYSSIANVCGSDYYTLKELCRNASASPIAFTDASPTPINNDNPNKIILRASISEADIDSHVQNISNLYQILSRTKLVLLSGHRKGSLNTVARRNFAYASTRLEGMFDGLDIPHISIPFMYGRNQPKIIAEIEKQNHITKVMRDIVGEFERFAMSRPDMLVT